MSATIIPARFIVLILHLFLTIIILWGRSQNIDACMHGRYSTSSYNSHDNELIIGASFSFALFALEFGGFLTAFSIIVNWQNIISLLCHGTGILVLSFYTFDVWCSDLYWYVFGFCCVLPGLTEIAVWVRRMLFDRYT